MCICARFNIIKICLDIMFMDYLNIVKIYLDIMFMDYIYSENPEKNLDILKNKIIVLIDKYKNEKTTFAFNSFKIQLHKEINNYKYMYPKYLNYLYEFMNVINITNKDVFIQEFKTKINDCDDLFVLYLFHITLKDD